MFEVLIRRLVPATARMEAGNMSGCSFESRAVPDEPVHGAKGLRILSPYLQESKALLYLYRPKQPEQDLKDSLSLRFLPVYEGRFAVFAVMEMSTVPGTARWYDLWSLNSAGRASREEAIRSLEQRSVVTSMLDVQADDQLLLLVTCLDGGTERLVVAARRLREHETADSLVIRQNK